jgi:hypothetical protein
MTSKRTRQTGLLGHEAPIFVTGLGRSGTTWVQWLLSQHPRIHVHGQPPPGFSWHLFWKWRELLVNEARWSVEANAQVAYEVAHYAGSTPEQAETIMRDLFRDFLGGTDPQRARWGVKWHGMASRQAQAAQVELLWPEVRWIVCLRDPFATIESIKNTFVPHLNTFRFARDWVAACRFALTHDSRRTALVQIDRLQELTPQQRWEHLNRLLAVIGEHPSRETDDFIRRWPIVHEVVPTEARTFTLSSAKKQCLLQDVSGLADCMHRLGYARNELAAA